MTTHYATLAGRILLLMACFQHWAIAAPPCDDNLAPVSDPRTGYHLREPNTRCEGFYKAPVSAADDLELVALTRGRLRFDSATIGPLQLSSPVLHEAVQLRGIALPDKTYYRLDGLIPAAGDFRWDLSDAVLPRHLHPEDLGLFGRLADQPEVVVPITVGPEPGLSLRVRDPNPYDKASWRYALRSNSTCAAMPPDWTAIRLPAHRMTGDPVEISLPDTLTGEICLEVATLPEGKAQWKQERWFIRLGD